MPFDRKKYPKEWEAIRVRILNRDGHKCKFCGVPNHRYVIRFETTEGEHFKAFSDKGIGFEIRRRVAIRLGIHVKAPVKIVLTIAHIESPDPMDCRDENLAALCQRCHLRLDAGLHAHNARRTRDRKVGQGELLEVAR